MFEEARCKSLPQIETLYFDVTYTFSIYVAFFAPTAYRRVAFHQCFVCSVIYVLLNFV